MPLYARLWVDILGDPKLLRAAREGAKNLVLLPWFIAWAKRADAEGRIEIDGKPAESRDIASAIPNATPRSVAKSLTELAAIGVLEADPDGCYRFAAWDFRNSGKASDSKDAIAARVRRHRERKKKASTPPDVTPSNALQALPDVTDVTSKRVERREKRGESREKRVENKRSSGGKGSLPPAAAEFGRHFYATAPLSRKRDIKRQLLATLNGGARLRRGVKVLAGSVERLERKCREVIAEGVKDPNQAIVVLLTKLADVSDDSPTERAAADERRDENEAVRRVQIAEAWLEANPDVAAVIDRDVPSDLPDVSRRIIRRAALLKAWTEAGEPTVAAAGASL